MIQLLISVRYIVPWKAFSATSDNFKFLSSLSLIAIYKQCPNMFSSLGIAQLAISADDSRRQVPIEWRYRT